jgi:ABC-2 type transport system permease protein
LSAGGAVAVSNIVFFTLAILGGLWFPVFLFPSIMQTLASFTPSYHLAELALVVVDAPGDHATTFNMVVIIVMTLLLLALTLWAWSRQR